MRDLIFEYDERLSGFPSDKKKYLDYFKNILCFITVCVYKKFVDYKTELQKLPSEVRSAKIADSSNSLIRIYNLLSDCYSVGQLDFRAVEDILLNLQIDDRINNVGRKFITDVGAQRFFDFDRLGNKLSKYIYSLKKSMISSRYIAKFGFDDLCECIRAFPILSEGSIEFCDYRGSSEYASVEVTLEGKPIDLGDLVIVLRDETVYYLNEVNVQDPRTFTPENERKLQCLTAEYSVPNGEALRVVLMDEEPSEWKKSPNELRFFGDTCIEDFLLKYRLVNLCSENKSSIAWEYSFIDNTYIKYLAIAIADKLDSEAKIMIGKKFGEQYPELFVRFDRDGFKHWDEIIIFLLLEVGVYELLFYLFKFAHLDYDEIKEEFRMRFGDNVTKLEKQYEIIRTPSLVASKNNDGKCHAKVQALILLAGKLLLANEVNVFVNDGTGAISEIKDGLKEVFENGSMKRSEKILYFANRLINLNSFIVTFYSVLLEFYAKGKAQALENFAKLFSGDSFGASEDLSVEAFRRASSSMRRRIYGKYSKLIQIKLWDDAAFSELIRLVKMSFGDVRELIDDLRQRGSYSAYFYEMTGRKSLFDYEEFSKIEDAVMNELLSLKDADDSLKNLYTALFRYIGYLTDGRLDRETTIEGAIYPIIGICTQSVISRDGYRYSYLSVPKGGDREGKPIKIITNETMHAGELYYCVPNVKRCFYSKNVEREYDGIWLNPQIIPYSVYLPNIRAELEQLQDKADYAQVAELIYRADEGVYFRLFGGLENAVKVISYLFDVQASPFYKKHIKFLRMVSDDALERNIAAVALFYDKLPEWDENVITDAFYAKGVACPASFTDACRSMSDTFQESNGNNYYVSDLCVHPDYRERGYAKHLLNCLTRIVEKEYSKKNIVLSVYANNTAALGLYSQMGFISYVSAYDNRGQSDVHEEKYYKMIKYVW